MILLSLKSSVDYKSKCKIQGGILIDFLTLFIKCFFAIVFQRQNSMFVVS